MLVMKLELLVFNSLKIFLKFFKGSSIANLHGSMLAEPLHDSSNFPVENGGTAIFPNVNTTQLVRAARQLLSSVTRFLFCEYF